MSVRVDPTKCSGIGLCEMTAPVVFEIGDDGQSHVLVEDPEGATTRLPWKPSRTAPLEPYLSRNELLGRDAVSAPFVSPRS